MTVEYNYTGRDYTSEYNRLLALLQSELPEYTDLNHSDAGIVLLRLLARETDQLNNYIDRVFAEGFLNTALFKQSLIDLGMLVGYLPTLANAATTTMLLTRKLGAEDDIVVSQYTEFSRSNGVKYINLEAATMTGDTLSVDVIQGSHEELTLRSTDFSTTDWSGHPRYNLGSGVAANSVSVVSGTSPSYTWTEVDSFWRSTSTDRHFLLELDENDDVWLVIGDGVKGSSLPLLTDIFVTYLQTDGKLGNCGAGVISSIPESLIGFVETSTNNIIANGGADAESTESIRRNIPRVTRTQRRGVTLEDYEALVENIPGVLWCQALDRNTITAYPWEFVALYIVPSGGGEMSDAFKATIQSELADWGHLLNWSGRYLLLDAVEQDVDVAVRVGLRTGYTSNTVIQNITAALDTLFDIEARGIGETLTFSDLHNAVINATGVSWCEFTTPTDNTTPDTGYIITPGTYTITVA